MAGFEKEFVLGESSWRQRLARDRRLAAHMLRVLWMWATLGRKLRRATEEAARAGRPMPIDRLKRGRV